MRFFKTRQFYMLNRVSSFLEKKKDTLFLQTPVLKKLIPEFHKRFKVIEDSLYGKTRPTFIQTSEKKDARDGLTNITEDLIAMICSHYGDDTGEAMPPEAAYTPTALRRASIEKFSDMCAQVIATAKKVPDLRDYGLSAGDIKEAEAYLKEYTAVKKAPAKRKKELADNNALINKSIHDLILFLKIKVDPVMRIATKNNRELKAGYFSFRKVLYRGPGNIENEEAKYRKSRAKAKVKEKAKRGAKKKT